jgi:hypothetical protein
LLVIEILFAKSSPEEAAIAHTNHAN